MVFGLAFNNLFIEINGLCGMCVVYVWYVWSFGSVWICVQLLGSVVKDICTIPYLCRTCGVVHCGGQPMALGKFRAREKAMENPIDR